MHDMLRETPIYQEILKEGREEGLEQGLEQGLQRGQLEVLRQAIIDVVVERFPKLVRLTKNKSLSSRIRNCCAMCWSK